MGSYTVSILANQPLPAAPSPVSLPDCRIRGLQAYNRARVWALIPLAFWPTSPCQQHQALEACQTAGSEACKLTWGQGLGSSTVSILANQPLPTAPRPVSLPDCWIRGLQAYNGAKVWALIPLAFWPTSPLQPPNYSFCPGESACRTAPDVILQSSYLLDEKKFLSWHST